MGPNVTGRDLIRAKAAKQDRASNMMTWTTAGICQSGSALAYVGVSNPLYPFSRLKIEELTLPKVSIKLLPGFGVQLSLHTKVSLHGSG